MNQKPYETTMNRKYINLMCPHCRMVQQGFINLNNTLRPMLVICDTEQGGCDKEFVIRIAVHVAITSHTIQGDTELKITDHTRQKSHFPDGGPQGGE